MPTMTDANATVRVRASVLCIHHNRILALRHEYPGRTGFWGVPGGEIEIGESPLDAAIRETCEETGYLVELTHDPGLSVTYDFCWKDTNYRCCTHWFGVRPIAGAPHRPHAGDEDFLTELSWLPVAQWRWLFPDHAVLQGAIATVLSQMAALGLVNGWRDNRP